MQLGTIPELVFVLFGVFALKLITEILIRIGLSAGGNSSKNNLQPVSIIICARNERENLMEFIPKIMEQDYPNFEVVVVNDRSVEDSHLVLRALANKYQNLKVTKVEETELHWAGKKFALSIGLKAAENDLVLLTDADCFPSSNRWLQQMSNNLNAKHKVVLGYGGYKKAPSLLNLIIRTETIMIAQQYLGLAKLGIPYMGVGRNLAYDKNLFFDNKGFASHQFMPSGDDDLFINEVSNSKNTTICFSKEAYTLSEPETTWKKYVEQKRRHLTTGHKYNWRSKIILTWLSLIRYTFWTLGIVACFVKPYWLAPTILALNFLLLAATHFSFTKAVKNIEILFVIGFTEIFLLIYYPFLFIWNTFVSGSPWKNY
jgi:glycosyltransferase involved in cell wall biosynthesis